MKRLRRVALGPYCTLIFESFETMLFQVQEMLLTEKGGDDQLPDELAAYNPLIPQGRELVATVLFEIDEAIRRARVLAELGGVEDHFYLEVGSGRPPAPPRRRRRTHPRRRQDLVRALPAFPYDPRAGEAVPRCGRDGERWVATTRGMRIWRR